MANPDTSHSSRRNLYTPPPQFIGFPRLTNSRINGPPFIQLIKGEPGECGKVWTYRLLFSGDVATEPFYFQMVFHVKSCETT